ncbi:putative hexose carrier protein [Eutypa lata UCREL1]|uniref:Putative hexose carrier protein n=1 Tax=Eutypa lata (strain UCR-EL1) TaxID=1287681 RepID=M7SRC0_EUTLA|nr:putative hexose carrier protein [Eutypa lata UCREL1]
MPHINIFGRGFKLRAAITIACQMAFILFGYDQGVFSGIVGNENFLDTFGHPSPSLEGIIFVILLVFGLPESPRYLYKHGRHEEAMEILCQVYDATPDHPKIAKEHQEILDALKIEQENGEYKWTELFKKDEIQTGRRVFLAYGMQFMNQMGGINLVVYYITSVLQINVGLDRNMSLLLGGIINAMFFIGSLFPTFFLDKYGRRNPMMWGSLGLGISMMMISILLSFQGRGGDVAQSTSKGSVAFFFTYMLIFGMTANCIPWVYVPEILPLHVRAKGTAVGISSNWLWNFFVVMITPTLLNSLAWKGYLIFMVLNFAFVPLVFFCYPETTNLSLEEIDGLFLEPHAVKTSLQVAKHGWSEESGWAKRRALAHKGDQKAEVTTHGHKDGVISEKSDVQHVGE